MAISKKGKRKITVINKKFLYWFFNEQDQTEFDGNQIKLILEDQSVYLKYGLEQLDDKRYVVVALNQNKLKVHVCCPKFEGKDGIVKPLEVSNLINWVASYSTKNEGRELQHAYSTQKGILDGEERIMALKTILETLRK